MEFLNGRKTYLVALCLGVLAVLVHLGHLDAATAAQLETLLLGGGLAALRAGVSKA